MPKALLIFKIIYDIFINTSKTVWNKNVYGLTSECYSYLKTEFQNFKMFPIFYTFPIKGIDNLLCA